jgi:hypothetical protein
MFNFNRFSTLTLLPERFKEQKRQVSKEAGWELKKNPNS